MTIDLSDAILRLIAAAGLSGVIGFEREVAQKAAGLRTHACRPWCRNIHRAQHRRISWVGPGTDRRSDRRRCRVPRRRGDLPPRSDRAGSHHGRGLVTAAAVGMAAGVGEFAVAMAATGVALVVLYLVGVVQWLFRGRRQMATAVLEVKLGDPAVVEAVVSTAESDVPRSAP